MIEKLLDFLRNIKKDLIFSFYPEGKDEGFFCQ